MAFVCIKASEKDHVYDEYFRKYSSSTDDYLRKYDRIYRRFREVRFDGQAYALDQERGYALFIVNHCFPLMGMRAPGTCALFLRDELITFNIAKNTSLIKNNSYVENIFEIMPFAPPFTIPEKERYVRKIIVEALAAIGFDGEPYGDKVRLAVVFDVQFGGHIF